MNTYYLVNTILCTYLYIDIIEKTWIVIDCKGRKTVKVSKGTFVDTTLVICVPLRVTQ